MSWNLVRTGANWQWCKSIDRPSSQKDNPSGQSTTGTGTTRQLTEDGRLFERQPQVQVNNSTVPAVPGHYLQPAGYWAQSWACNNKPPIAMLDGLLEAGMRSKHTASGLPSTFGNTDHLIIGGPVLFSCNEPGTVRCGNSSQLGYKKQAPLPVSSQLPDQRYAGRRLATVPRHAKAVGRRAVCTPG
jgi:hypothetical protein